MSSRVFFFQERCRFSHVDAPLSAWHTAPSLQPQGRRHRGPLSPVLCLQLCVDVLATLCSLCPGNCLAPQHTWLPVFRHELPLCMNCPCNWCSHVPATAPAQPKQGARSNTDSLLCSPQDMLREEDKFLLGFVYNRAEAVLPTELKKWTSLRWHFKGGQLGRCLSF